MEENNQQRNWFIYIHTNKVNGKVYIGQTGNDPKTRWHNGLGYKGCTHFERAVAKYGWDGFTHEILLDNLTKDEADEAEIELIQKYNARNPEYGYNIREGGSHGLHSNETKFKISKALKGKHYIRHLTPEQLKQSYANRPGGQGRSKGFKLSEEEKENISKRLSKPIECIETGKIYKSLTEAEELTGINHSSISKACRGVRNKAGNLHWRFVNK